MSSPTIKQAVEEFIVAKRADGLSENSIRWYAAMLKDFFLWFEAEQRGEGETYVRPSPVNNQPYNSGDVARGCCPSCGRADRQIKIGRTAAGSQRFKCQRCGKKYTPTKELSK